MLTKLKVKMLKILTDTKLYYASNPRAIDEDSNCFYSVKNSDAHCAIGRYMTKRQQAKAIRLDCNGYLVADLKVRHDAIFPKKLENLPISFLTMLQKFHDNSEFWKSNLLGGSDLSEEGEVRFKALSKAIIEGEYNES